MLTRKGGEIPNGDPLRYYKFLRTACNVILHMLKLSFLCLLKVRWDENSTIPRPERVSSWKIEPALAPPALNPLPMPRPKRPRPNMVPSSPDSSVLTREGTVLLPLQSVLDSLSSCTQNICSFSPLKGTNFFPSLLFRSIKSYCRPCTARRRVSKGLARSRISDLERQFCGERV